MAYNKYNNKKCYLDGYKFDSKAEMARYEELKLLVRAKEIFDLELQPKFLLQASFRIGGGKMINKFIYKADFKYTDQDGKVVVEDVKGALTEVYKLKKKMFLYEYLVRQYEKVDIFVEIKKTINDEYHTSTTPPLKNS